MDFNELWRADLAAAARPLSWLWRGYLAPGLITVLTSQWKSGKTTLISLLLARRKCGGTLAGAAVAPGGAVVISEESAHLWNVRDQRVHLGDDNAFLCRPYGGKPTMEQWCEILKKVERLHRDRGLDLVVIDSLATMMPVRAENSATAIIDALAPLRGLTEQGLAAGVLHHPKKGDALEGQLARGSGALVGYVDIVIEMLRVRSPRSDRCRRLLGQSRFEETPRNLVVELHPDGMDYDVLTEKALDDFAVNWEYLRPVLEDAEHKLTRAELLADWPADFPKPAPQTLWRWLDRALDEKLVCRDGTGRKRKPFRYWLPDKEEEWKLDPLHALKYPEQTGEDIVRMLMEESEQRARERLKRTKRNREGES